MARARPGPVILRVLTLCTLVVDVGAFGFCLDNAPSLLAGTGFAGSPSNYSNATDCQAAGHVWCPLSNETDTWDVDGVTVEYYWFSACCAGRQAAGLVTDPSVGVPTCEAGTSHEECTSTHWQHKLMKDLVSEDSGYDFKALASTVLRPSLRAPGRRSPSSGSQPEQPSCHCAPDEARCEKRNADGTRCVVCRTRDKCSNDAVSVGIHFFKLHTVDLKTSLLTFAAWLRESWRDPRLKYNAQCYGGLESFEAIGQSGSMENSAIWTPDLELYNGEESIWQGSMQAHLAQVYPCSSSGKPVRGSCGSVFWSRPGLLKALCKYEGLLSFPLDHLKCKLELAGFIIDGRRQDVVLRSIDDGVSWTGKDSLTGFAGITAGSSFQDYRIVSIESERYVVYYDCCPNAPYPTLVYSIGFQRSSAYYVLRLILPAIFLACTSFVTFWMNPEIGERLGFCITVILAMFTNDVVAAELMPIANEKVMMDYLSLGCSLFGMFSLFETGIVLFLFHHGAETWKAVLVPVAFLKFFEDPLKVLRETLLLTSRAGSLKREDTIAWAHNTNTESAKRGDCEDPEGRKFAETLNMINKTVSKDTKIRRQLYRQIFFTIDKDFSGSLSLGEVSEFAHFMFGDAWHYSKAVDFIRSIDTNGDGTLGFNEFSAFCDTFLPYVDDLKFMKAMLDGFLQIIERKKLARQRMWQERAKCIDQFCRWSVPPGFVLFLCVLFAREDYDFALMVDDFGRQFLLMFTAFLALTIAITAFAVYRLYQYWLHKRVASKRKAAQSAGGLFSPVASPREPREPDHPCPQSCIVPSEGPCEAGSVGSSSSGGASSLPSKGNCDDCTEVLPGKPTAPGNVREGGALNCSGRN